jgi:hypothetical protein
MNKDGQLILSNVEQVEKSFTKQIVLTPYETRVYLFSQE